METETIKTSRNITIQAAPPSPDTEGREAISVQHAEDRLLWVLFDEVVKEWSCASKYCDPVCEESSELSELIGSLTESIRLRRDGSLLPALSRLIRDFLELEKDNPHAPDVIGLQRLDYLIMLTERIQGRREVQKGGEPIPNTL